MVIKITVKTLESQNFEFDANDDWTVKEFKENIQSTVNVPADEQRLIFCGRVLLDDKRLIEYNCNGKVVHLVRRPPPLPNNPDQPASGADSNNNTNSSTGTNEHLRFFEEGQIFINAMTVGSLSGPSQPGFQFPVSLGPFNFATNPVQVTTTNSSSTNSNSNNNNNNNDATNNDPNRPNTGQYPQTSTPRTTSQQTTSQQNTTSNSTQTANRPIGVISGRLPPFDFFLLCLSPRAGNSNAPPTGLGPQTTSTNPRIHVRTANQQTAAPNQNANVPRTQADVSAVPNSGNTNQPPRASVSANPLGDLVGQLFMGPMQSRTSAPASGGPAQPTTNNPDSFMNMIPEIALNAASQILSGVLGIPTLTPQQLNIHTTAPRQQQPPTAAASAGSVMMDIDIDDNSSSQSSRYQDARESQTPPTVPTVRRNDQAEPSTSVAPQQASHSRDVHRSSSSHNSYDRLEAILQNHRDWIPIIEADINLMASQTATSNSQHTFSDAYLSSIPRKRRRLLTASSDRVLILQPSSSQAITNLLRRAITSSSAPDVGALDQVLLSISSDAELQNAYDDYIKTAVEARLKSDFDYCPRKFENSSKYYR